MRLRGTSAALVASVAACTAAPAPHAPDARPAEPNEAAVAAGPDLQSGCKRGDALSCFTLGNLAEQQDAARAAAFYREACQRSFLVGCYNQGVLLEQAGQDRAAFESYKRACDGGEPRGCANLGYTYEHGIGVDPSIPKALELYTKACAGGAMIACNNLGVCHRDAVGVPRDNARAAELFAQACGAGHDAACMRGAWLVAQGCTDPGHREACAHTGVDDAGMSKLLDEACERREPLACAASGLYWEAGRGIPQSFGRARQRYEQICDSAPAGATAEPAGAGAWACNNLGNLYRRGQGVAADPPRAVAYYEKACKAGFAIACRDLGAMLLNGDGIDVDRPRGVAAFARACALRMLNACTELQVMCVLGAPREACASVAR